MKGERNRANLYASILDCSAPYYMEKSNKYQCTMKLIDSTLNQAKGESMTATFFAKSADDLPHVTKIGSIIRLHRVQTKKFKKNYQINCNVGNMSAWILFDPAEGAIPIAESGKGHTFTSEDKSILAKTRKFTKSYFASKKIEAIDLKAAEKSPKDFDILCIISNIKKKGNNNIVTLSDTKKTVQMKVPVSKKLPFVSGEIIRIRGANYVDGKKFEELELKDYSNILLIDEDYKSAKELYKGIKKSGTKGK